jgi:hypothetical protein
LGGVERGGAERVELDRRATEALRISAGEDDLRPFGACTPGGLEADAGAAAEHDDGLSEEIRLPLAGGGGGRGAHALPPFWRLVDPRRLHRKLPSRCSSGRPAGARFRVER